ncbi:MAG: hypothetical protein WD231_01580 [Candidatus Woykebacteria bacterium]
MNWFILAIIAFFSYGAVNLLFKLAERTGSSVAAITIVLYFFGGSFR